MNRTVFPDMHENFSKSTANSIGLVSGPALDFDLSFGTGSSVGFPSRSYNLDVIRNNAVAVNNALGGNDNGLNGGGNVAYARALSPFAYAPSFSYSPFAARSYYAPAMESYGSPFYGYY